MWIPWLPSPLPAFPRGNIQEHFVLSHFNTGWEKEQFIYLFQFLLFFFFCGGDEFTCGFCSMELLLGFWFFFFSLFPLSWMNELNLNSTSVLLTELFSLEVKDCVVAQCVSILLPMRFFDHFGLAFELLKSTATKLGRSGEVSKQILPSSMETAQWKVETAHHFWKSCNLLSQNFAHHRIHMIKACLNPVPSSGTAEVTLAFLGSEVTHP